jgi:protoporphyrinogen oxidase
MGIIMCNKSDTHQQIVILGGGPAGLTVGYYAQKKNLPFTIYEQNDLVGGNSITLKHEDFMFDSGAHLLLDKDPRVTKEIFEILENHLNKISLPLQTYYDGKLIDFPFSPLNLMVNLGIRKFIKSNFEIATKKFRKRNAPDNFTNYVKHVYGETISDLFLLNYSEKLWGKSCSDLSSRIAGKLLTGFTFKTFLIELLRGREAKIQHTVGSMYYPKKGFGTIMEKIAQLCGPENIRINSKITKILHNDNEIRLIEINGREKLKTGFVVSTIPLNLFIQLMDPIPSKDILTTAKSLQFRDLIIVTLFLDRETVTDSASIHFPNPDFSITRIHEPKNRYKSMAPAGKTSLVAEIPCFEGDRIWLKKDKDLIQQVISELRSMGWIETGEILDGVVFRLHHAYPILDLNYQNKIKKIRNFLDGFNNLKITGRTGAFEYLSFHHIMRESERIIDAIPIH